MRLSSMFFALLLAPLTLPAQYSAPNSSPYRFDLRGASACPVGIAVNRVARGAVIETNSESDWLNAHPNLSLPELQHALRNEPGFNQLSRDDQQQRLDQLAQLYGGRHGQGLDIAFFRRGPWIVEPQMVSADVTVHGYPPTTHIIPAAPYLPAEVTETFRITADSGKALLRSSVWTERMIMINWVELTRVDYADGTSWQSSAPRQCGAAPSLYLPVKAPAR
jgi:hypothetical protein